MKHLTLTFPDEGVTARALLLEDKAPATAALLWKLLETPLENWAFHAMFTGRELSFTVPEDRLEEEEVFALPPENQTMFPLPGALIWNACRPYQWMGTPHTVYDLGIFYGPESRILLPTGWKPSTQFASITENLEAFAAVCARCQREGQKRIRIQRA